MLNFGEIFEPLGFLDRSVIGRFISEASRKRAIHLEMMAAAFLKETKIPVKYCECVESHGKDGSIRWFYRDRRTA